MSQETTERTTARTKQAVALHNIAFQLALVASGQTEKVQIDTTTVVNGSEVRERFNITRSNVHEWGSVFRRLAMEIDIWFAK